MECSALLALRGYFMETSITGREPSNHWWVMHSSIIIILFTMGPVLWKFKFYTAMIGIMIFLTLIVLLEPII